MEVNTDKSKIMIINKQLGQIEKKEIKRKGKGLGRVSTYNYLGSILSEDGKIEAELANRAKTGSRIYPALNKTQNRK